MVTLLALYIPILIQITRLLPRFANVIPTYLPRYLPFGHDE